MVNMDGISALMDGELDEREAQRELARLKEDVELRERWDRFHLVSDALRVSPCSLRTSGKRLPNDSQPSRRCLHRAA
jgi:negative regulator of sigma E activity